MNKINIIKLLLIFWFKVINLSRTKNENTSNTIEMVDVVEKSKINSPSMPIGYKTMFHINDRFGKYLQKTLLIKGIIVILYKLQRRRTKYGTYFILPVLSHVVTACIDPPDSADGKANRAVEIQIAAAGLLYLTILPALYGTVLTDLIAAMRTAKGANQVLKAWRNLKAQLELIMEPVQKYMNTLEATQAGIVCEYYKFKIRGMGGNTAQVFEGEPGTLAGEIDLLFPVGPGECSYTVKIYNLDRTSFVYCLGTDLAHQTIQGFVSGSLQQLSVTIVHHGEVVSESQIISVRAK